MILHLEPKKPVADSISAVLGVHVRDVKFIDLEGKLYRKRLEIIIDPDLHPAALESLYAMTIMQKHRAFEFIGIEAITIPSSDPTLLKNYETVIKAIFINRK